MVVLHVIQLVMGLTLSGIGYLLLQGKMHSLVSGFASRSEQEQKDMLEAGYMTVTGRGLFLSGAVLLIGLVFGLMGLFQANFFMWGVFLLVLFVTAYRGIAREPERTRKRNRIVMHVTVVFTAGVLIFVTIAGFSDNDLIVRDDSFEVSGLYGDTWSLDDVEAVSLETDGPSITMRTNGFSFGSTVKGRFRLSDGGRALLFLELDEQPFLRIELDDDTVWIHDGDRDVTESWYDELTERLADREGEVR
ncbi:DUF3784 domain-containing protein [Salisediminibacterium selenitireducens]|uniref:DUF3784 domain-containing protein n=1 Tax=Bacillus selenitireducens (strain ATCC 700615 / DSM 15326 / MLS10) TaxID=439292 RepID=D6XXF8_BACIE|nr:DUF3784 domain-containing protein [Salisediminibacterium selenitireducens]ADH98015.1 hypothetical protein Bsel_0477 [[Bacillus] selenitireducens MLS10]